MSAPVETDATDFVRLACECRAQADRSLSTDQKQWWLEMAADWEARAQACAEADADGATQAHA